MAKGIKEMQRFFADQNLTDETFRAFVLFMFGRRKLLFLDRILADSAPEAQALRRQRQREGHIKALWRRLRTDMRTRYHAAKHRARKRMDDPDYQNDPEFIYYDTLAKVLGKGLDRIDNAYAKAKAPDGDTVIMTPTQWGASKGLPNNGLMWADWIKPEAKEMMSYLADDTMVGKSPKARPPRPFHVNPPDFLKAQRQRLYDLIELQLDNAETRLRTLEKKLGDKPSLSRETAQDREDTHRFLTVQAEVIVMRKCRDALDNWPRTRPLPVDPLHLIGTRLVTVTNAVANVEPEKASEMSLAAYRAAVDEVIKEAMQRGTDGRKVRLAHARSTEQE